MIDTNLHVVLRKTLAALSFLVSASPLDPVVIHFGLSLRTIDNALQIRAQSRTEVVGVTCLALWQRNCARVSDALTAASFRFAKECRPNPPCIGDSETGHWISSRNRWIPRRRCAPRRRPGDASPDECFTYADAGEKGGFCSSLHSRTQNTLEPPPTKPHLLFFCLYSNSRCRAKHHAPV